MDDYLALLLQSELLLVEAQLEAELLCVVSEFGFRHARHIQPLVVLVKVLLELVETLLRAWCRVDELFAVSRFLVQAHDLLPPFELCMMVLRLMLLLALIDCLGVRIP